MLGSSDLKNMKKKKGHLFMIWGAVKLQATIVGSKLRDRKQNQSPVALRILLLII